MMEVHQHTHTARKKWYHYFWEFFMLFLAVTLGFIVENWREHTVEHRREKQFVRSMIEDLKFDTASLNGYMTDQKRALEAYDSVIFLLNQKSRTAAEQKRLYYQLRIAMRLGGYPETNESTYEQMKSSGNLRLFSEQYIADSISRYYFKLKDIALITTQLLLRQQSLLDYEGEVFNGSAFQSMVDKKTFTFNEPPGNPPLMTDDERFINKCVIRIHYLFSLMLFSQNFIKNQVNEAARLILFLKKEYHLE
jgi:hypothetical protein